jgi:hypothetical protein
MLGETSNVLFLYWAARYTAVTTIVIKLNFILFAFSHNIGINMDSFVAIFDLVGVFYSHIAD